MTAHELARLLLAGPDLRVVVDGYESDYDDPVVWTTRVIIDDTGPDPEYAGRHSAVWLGCHDGMEQTRVVVVSRRPASEDEPVEDVWVRVGAEILHGRKAGATISGPATRVMLEMPDGTEREHWALPEDFVTPPPPRR